MLRPIPVFKSLMSRLIKTEQPVSNEPTLIKREEMVLCAALWINDHRRYPDQPVNIEAGFVVAGRSHAQCFSAVEAALSGQKQNRPGETEKSTNVTLGWEMPVSGFLTSKNRFLDRKSAFELAFEVGQLEKKVSTSTDGMLRSTDLY